jgi:oligopeptide/dipeptide ABC transporter ATP-binding protein
MTTPVAVAERPADAPPPSGGAAHLLDVRHLTTRFGVEGATIHAASDVSFHVDTGEVLAIVGESGSGKSVTMLSVMGLIPTPPGRIDAGEVLFEGQDLLRLPRGEMRTLRGSRLAMIFQEPTASLDPVFTVGSQIDEALRTHLGLARRAARARSIELLAMVRIADPRRVAESFPHQLSGGMCQRAMLAMAIACDPRLLIADEPTTALDITTQAQLLELIRGLQEQLGMAVIWITHDLGIVAGLADRVAVMYGGRIVETGRVEDIYADPVHPYTQGLLRAIPRIDLARAERLVPIAGSPPDLAAQPAGCSFEPRCAFRLERCTTDRPELLAVEGSHGRGRACWAPLEALRQRRPQAAEGA